MARLRWGLLGTARINRLLIPAIRASSRSDVAVVASRDAARAASYAREWGIPVAAPSYEALLAADIDVVYVPLPNSLHVPWTLRAVNAGKHVLCEKPLALDPRDVDRLGETAAARGRVIAEAFGYRHHAQTQRVLDFVRDGMLGELRTVQGSFTYLRDRDADVRLDPALGGGALWDIGCYPVGFSLMLTGGAPTTVTGAARIGPSGVDEHFTGTLAFPNGISAEFSANFHDAYDTRMHLIGTSGTITLTKPFRPGVSEDILLRRGAHLETVRVDGRPSHEDLVVDFEDAVLGLGRPLIPLDESRRLALTLMRLHESARIGAALPVS